MKANEFVKNYGWDAAKHKADELKMIESMGDKLSSQAKILIEYVDSYILVEEYGGLDEACYHVYVETIDDCYYNKDLADAIKLVEEYI